MVFTLGRYNELTEQVRVAHIQRTRSVQRCMGIKVDSHHVLRSASTLSPLFCNLMNTLTVHPRLVPGALTTFSPITTDMSRHIDWYTKEDAILDEPLTFPSYSCLIVRVEGVFGTHTRARFVVTAADFITVTVRDFLFGLNVYLHHVPNSSTNADSVPEYRLADARALAETQYDIDEMFARIPDSNGVYEWFPEKAVTLPGLVVSSEDFLGQKPHTPINKRAVVQWLRGRSIFTGIEPDVYDEAMLVVHMAKPEDVGIYNFPIRNVPARGYQRILGPA